MGKKMVIFPTVWLDVDGMSNQVFSQNTNQGFRVVLKLPNI